MAGVIPGSINITTVTLYAGAGLFAAGNPAARLRNWVAFAIGREDAQGGLMFRSGVGNRVFVDPDDPNA